jgi:hypothetical protein
MVAQAGLFSAVLTAFVIESYQMLQEDVPQLSKDALYTVSRQIYALASGGGAVPAIETLDGVTWAAIAVNAVSTGDLQCHL